MQPEKTAQDRFAFLEQASNLLASSLDYEVTLASVARLAVPRLADWCVVHIQEESGLRQLAVAHVDSAKVELARELGRRYPPDLNAPRGMPMVLRTGKSELIPEITEEMLVSGARDEAHLAILRELGLKSCLLVPLIARGRALGVLTFVAAESGQSYGAEDLGLAEELAHRAALAVDNARLYREAQEAAQRRATVIGQLSLLVEASGNLTRRLELPAVLAATLELSHQLIAADAYGLWRRSPRGEWKIVDSAGLSEEYLRLQGYIQTSPAHVPEQPVVAEDVQTLPMLEERRAAYLREGIRSLLVVPLRIHAETAGTLVFYYRSLHRFDEVTLCLAMALANLAASAVSTAELYQQVQDELRQRTQTEQKLREADQRKDEFLAMLAHELRNPLAPIRNGLHILTQAGLPGPLSGVHEIMERQVGHMSRLLDDLLDVSRITRGKIELRREVIDVATLVRRSVESTQGLIDERRHQLIVMPAEGPLFVEGDLTRLEQVLVNLLTNACKYTDPGGKIQIETQGEDHQVVLRVRDWGMGIAAALLPQVFDLFVQGGPPPNRSAGGLGIGLTLVKKLVELHGGAVEAASSGPGQGSVFTIRLPPHESAPAAPAAGGQASEPPEGTARRVLVVDDNIDAAESMGLLLRMQGHQVRVAHNGATALQAAETDPPEVVLLDIGMPGMDGHEVCRRLRRQPAMRSALVVAVTGWGQEEDVRLSKEAGFDLHLTKPVDPIDLRRAVAGQLGCAQE